MRKLNKSISKTKEKSFQHPFPSWMLMLDDTEVMVPHRPPISINSTNKTNKTNKTN